MASSSSPSFPFHIKEHTVPAQHVREWPRATANSQEDVLYVHIKQYIPKDNPNPRAGDVTIIGAHANGFPKELYEALWADLHSRSRSSGKPQNDGFRIRGIWIADVTNQGYSGELNESTLGDETSWHDASRDLLHMTNVFRAEMPRPLIGIGHSFGGNILTFLSLLHPRLLTTLVLLDPVIVKFRFEDSGPGNNLTKSSTFRRETWPSREAAAESFRRSPFYCHWDPRVLDAWIEHALRDTPTALFPASNSRHKDGEEREAGAGTTLRTTKHQEVMTFFRPLWPHVLPDGSVSREGAPDFDMDMLPLVDSSNPYPFYRAEGPAVLRRLPEVRPTVLWVFGGESDLSIAGARRHKMDTTGVGPGGSGGEKHDKVEQVVMEGRGHLFPLEVPGEVAGHATDWISRQLKSWRKAEHEYDEWTKLPLRQKSTLSQTFIDHVGQPPARTKKDGGAAAEKADMCIIDKPKL